MVTVRGTVEVNETGIGLPAMTVHLFAVPREALPEEVLQDPDWDAHHSNGWARLNAYRLGSTLSASEGRFTFGFHASRCRRNC